MKNIVFLLTLTLFCSPVWAANGDMGGADPNGSEAYPYLIEDIDDFDVFASDSSYWASGVHTKLMTNIDLAGRTYTTAIIAPDMDIESYWHQGTPFIGVFDGNNKTIRHFLVNQPDISHIGIFGCIETGGKVCNLNITDVNIIGYDHIACLAGHILDGTIENCNVSGTLKSTDYTAGGLVAAAWTSSTISNCRSTVTIHSVGHSVGGLIGYNDHSSVVNCHSRSTVSGEGSNLGGLIGYNYYGTVLYSSSTSTVFKTDLYVNAVGGLIGCSEHGLISSCWSDSQVTGDSKVGGLVGLSGFSNIIAENSYSTGQVYGYSYVGGVVGGAGFDGGSILTNCYSACSVNGDLMVGGIMGGKDGASITACFWNIDNCQTNAAYYQYIGAPDYTYTPVYSTPGIAEGKTTSEMQTQSTFASWDFSDSDGDPADWMMLRENEDYPRLAWQEIFDGDIAGLYGVNTVDFALLASQWNESACNELNDWCQGADIDHLDGVDIKDLLAIADDWLKGS